MRREEYLHTLTEQIRCKMARGTIEQEINDHIEDLNWTVIFRQIIRQRKE